MARVLIVDDEPLIRRSLKAFLERRSHEVFAAEGAAEAFALVTREDFDVVLADIIMPETSGLALLEQIRAQRPEVEVVLITGQPDTQSAIEAVRRGAFDYLSKPLEGERVAAVVERAFAVRTARLEKHKLLEERARQTERLERLVLHRAVSYRQSEDRLQRIAADLHDVVAEKLRRALESLQSCRATTEDPGLAQTVELVQDLIEESAGRLHRQAHDLSPIVLSDQGIAAALEALAKRFADESGIACVFVDDGVDKPLPPPAMTTAYRCVADLLANVAQHASAQHVEVRICRTSEHVEIAVSDDGAGFEYREFRQAVVDRESFGLVGIEARMGALQGEVEVQSRRGRGTHVLLRLPLKRPATSDETSAR